MPSFELYEMLPQLALQVRKTSKHATTSSTLGVLALNVLGQGGIGERWQTGGLNASTNLECTADTPSACSDGGCATVWMQSSECAVFNATHVGLIGKKLQPAVAQLNISVAARSLMERRYSFLLHVPVWNGSGWQFASIDARLDVRALADAQQSEVRVGSASNSSRPGSAAVVVNHLEKVAVEIVAHDVDGALINRTGETITVRMVRSDRTANVTELAQFDAARGVYFVSAAISTPGEYLVLLDTDAQTPAASKATVRVVCAKGYRQDGGTCTEETSETQMIVGGTIGGVFVLVGASGGWLLYKNRAHALRFLVSFFKSEFLLVFKTMNELWDITGDRMPRIAACRACSCPLGWQGIVRAFRLGLDSRFAQSTRTSLCGEAGTTT